MIYECFSPWTSMPLRDRDLGLHELAFHHSHRQNGSVHFHGCQVIDWTSRLPKHKLGKCNTSPTLSLGVEAENHWFMIIVVE